MERLISKSEKLDIFLALATFYEFKVEGENDSQPKKDQITQAVESLTAIEQSDLKLLKKKVKRFESLSKERQKTWQTFWLEKLRNRGQTMRLDENLHAEHLADVLLKEPKNVCVMILQNLPLEVAKAVLILLPKGIANEKFVENPKSKKRLPTEEMFLLMRRKFLSNFTAFENIYKPNAIDKLSAKELEYFSRSVGIREIAIMCRGIATKENLAVFLKPFDENLTKEIAFKIKEFEEIEPERVVLSENFFGDIYAEGVNLENSPELLGLRLIALTLFRREKNAQQYSGQKLPLKIFDKFATFLLEFENRYDSSNAQVRKHFNKIGTEIVELASSFKEKGKI